jgi:hypothetical protein
MYIPIYLLLVSKSLLEGDVHLVPLSYTAPKEVNISNTRKLRSYFVPTTHYLAH